MKQKNVQQLITGGWFLVIAIDSVVVAVALSVIVCSWTSSWSLP